MHVRSVLASVAAGVLTTALLSAAANADQLVTAKTREWAKEALQNEKLCQSGGAKCQPTGENSLAVLYFQNNTGKAELDPLQKGLAIMLTTDLSGVKGLQIVERIKLQALAQEIGLGGSGLVTPESAPRVGKLMGAKWLVGGNLEGPIPEQILTIQSKLLEVSNSAELGGSKSAGALADLMRLEKELVFAIVEQLKVKLVPEEKEKLSKPFSTSVKAVNALFIGVDAADRGDYHKAADAFDEAIKEDPSIPVAAQALNEMRNLGLLDGWSRSQGGVPVVVKPEGGLKQTAKGGDAPETRTAVTGKKVDKKDANAGTGTGSSSTGTGSGTSAGSSTSTGGAGASDPVVGSSRYEAPSFNMNSSDLLSSVTSSTSQTYTLITQDSKNVVSPAIQKISTASTTPTTTPVTGTLIFPSTSTAKTALSAVNSMLKSETLRNLHR